MNESRTSTIDAPRRTSGYRRLRLLLSVAVVVGAAACGSDQPTADDTSTGADDPTTDAAPDETEVSVDDGQSCEEGERGGTVTIAEPLFTRGLDPIMTLGSAVAGGTESAAVFDTLLRWDPDTGDYEPHLAESIEHNSDATEWTLRLRDGPTFGNGDPVTADAVRFSVDRMKDSTSGSGALAQQVTDMEVVDDRTIVFRFTEPWGSFPYVLAEETGMIVNPNVAESVDEDTLNTSTPVGAGAGPYTLESFVDGEEVVLTAKDDYWGGPVCIETLRFVPISVADTAYGAFRNDEVQMTIMTDHEVIAEAMAEGMQGHGQVGGGGDFISFNHTAEPTDDVRLRTAVQLAIDYDVLNDRVFDGTAEAASSLMPSESPVFGGPGLSYDPDQASSIVQQLESEGWDGHLDLLGSTAPDDVEMAITIEAMLEKVGFDVDVEQIPNSQMTGRIIDKTFEAAIYAPVLWEEGLVEKMTWFKTRLGYTNEQWDAAAADVRAATGRAETKAAMEEIQGVWNDTLPAVNLFMAHWWFATKPEIKGIVWTRAVIPMFHDAFLDTGES